MGKILTYADIESIKNERGYVDQKTIVNDQGVVVRYEGSNHCPSAKDWDLRVYNVKNSYDESSTQCTDIIDTANRYPVLFGYSNLGSNISMIGLDVTFQDGCNYKIHYGEDNSAQSFTTPFTIGTSGYPSRDYVFYGIGEASGQHWYYHSVSTTVTTFYTVETMTIKLSHALTGTFQVYSGTYITSSNKNLYNFGPRLSSPRYVSNQSTVSVNNFRIPYADYGNQSFLVFIGLTKHFAS